MWLVASLNISIAVLLLLSPFWWSKKYFGLPFFNPISIVTIFLIPFDLFKLIAGPFFILGNLTDFGYQFAVLMTNVEKFVALIVFIFFVRWRGSRKIVHVIPRMSDWSESKLKYLSYVFYFLFLICFIFLASKTGGVVDWIANPRLSYMTKRDGNGIYYALCVSLVSISYFLFSWATDRFIKLTLGAILFTSSVYFLGSKGFVLSFFSFYIVAVWRIDRDKSEKMFWIGAPIAFFALLLNFFSGGGDANYSSVLEYFDYYITAARYYTDYFEGKINLFSGQVILTSLWEYIPRGMYPEKPYVYGILHVVEFYYPGGAESGNTPAFDGGVFKFADFGVAGVFVLSFFDFSIPIKAILLRFVFDGEGIVFQKKYSKMKILASVLIFSPAFGAFFSSGLLIGLLLAIMIISVVSLKGRSTLVKLKRLGV